MKKCNIDIYLTACNGTDTIIFRVHREVQSRLDFITYQAVITILRFVASLLRMFLLLLDKGLLEIICLHIAEMSQLIEMTQLEHHGVLYRNHKCGVDAAEYTLTAAAKSSAVEAASLQ